MPSSLTPGWSSIQHLRDARHSTSVAASLVSCVATSSDSGGWVSLHATPRAISSSSSSGQSLDPLRIGDVRR